MSGMFPLLLKKSRSGLDAALKIAEEGARENQAFHYHSALGAGNKERFDNSLFTGSPHATLKDSPSGPFCRLIASETIPSVLSNLSSPME